MKSYLALKLCNMCVPAPWQDFSTMESDAATSHAHYYLMQRVIKLRKEMAGTSTRSMAPYPISITGLVWEAY